jgi:8-oxo-dGTP diphosphatase
MFPKLTVDPLIITKENEVVLVKRKFNPFAGSYALPGGFVEHGETVENACMREAFEETGLKVKIKKIVGVYSDPNRDPRGHVISIVFLCRPVGGELAKKTRETKDAKAFKKEEIKDIKLAFDHEKILKDVGLL